MIEDNESNPSMNGSTALQEDEEDGVPHFEIPIFTEEFLDHNKCKLQSASLWNPHLHGGISRP